MEKVAGNSHYLQNEFSLINSRECTLLVEFNEHGFSYSILNNEKNEFLYSGISNVHFDLFSGDKEQIEDIFKKDVVFKYSYEKVIILLDHFYNTLVPTELYLKDNIEKVLSFNVKLPNAELIYLSDEINNVSYFNLYINSNILNITIKKNFIESEIFSTNSVIVANSNKLARNDDLFYIHLSLNHLQCLYYKEGDLIFNNSFKIDNSEELTFSVLNIFDQLGLNTERTTLYLSGFINKEDENYKLLYKYIKNIKFVKRSLRMNYSHRVKRIPAHFFVHHYAALL